MKRLFRHAANRTKRVPIVERAIPVTACAIGAIAIDIARTYAIQCFVTTARRSPLAAVTFALLLDRGDSALTMELYGKPAGLPY